MTDGAHVVHVEPDGRFVAWAPREVVHRDRLIHLSVNILIFHPDGRLLVQKRHRSKATFPSYWDVSCSGHVDYADFTPGLPYSEAAGFLTAAPRELFEELGIRVPLTSLGVFPPQPNVNYERTQVFSATCPGPFKLQADEVEAVQWVSKRAFACLSPTTPLLQWMARDIVPWTREQSESHP